MKINIASLMSIISEEEKNLNKLLDTMGCHTYSITIQELDGKETILEDYKNDFENELKELDLCYERLTKFKKVLFEKNNNFKLNDGRTIQQAIADTTYLRKIKTFYESLLNNRNSKSRITEVNNSYFESRILNYDIKEIKNKLDEVEKQIQQTDFEISKLNSIEFEINI